MREITYHRKGDYFIPDLYLATEEIITKELFYT